MIDSKISVTKSNTELITLSAIVGERTIKLQITKVDGQFKTISLSNICEGEIISVPVNVVYFSSLEEIDIVLQLFNKIFE